MTTDYRALVDLAEQRIAHGTRERSAGADDKARAIADEVARRGRGGAKTVADELGVSEKTVSQAVARARNADVPHRALPHDTFEQLLAVELPGVPPRPAADWRVLAHIVRGTVIDATWLHGPGPLLADEVEDLDDDYGNAAALAVACRSFTRVQALAVIDSILRGDLAALPTTKD